MEGIALAAQLCDDGSGHGRFRVHPDGFDDDSQVFIVVQELHGVPPWYKKARNESGRTPSGEESGICY